MKRKPSVVGTANCADWLTVDWGSCPAAPGRTVGGCFNTLVLSGELLKANAGTHYVITHEVLESEAAGRRIYQTLSLTRKRKAQTMRDLAKFGIKNKRDLEQPIPARRIRCLLTVVVRIDAEGAELKEITDFKVYGMDASPLNDSVPAPDRRENRLHNELYSDHQSV